MCHFSLEGYSPEKIVYEETKVIVKIEAVLNVFNPDYRDLI